MWLRFQTLQTTDHNCDVTFILKLLPSHSNSLFVVRLIWLLAGLVAGQRVDDFTCPDTLPGFYPHLYSCDRYWACSEGEAEERTCGNGLGFIDTDETFTLEQCAELHLVECGERTELEPAVSSPHCPRAWGTYEDSEDCGVFWVCQAGKATRYSCPPGLAYDKESHGCRWADQVAECSGPVMLDEVGGQFQCPHSQPGVFTKHAHPEDCRQYYLCISGLPREYGCPLGTVFNTGTGNGADGECSDPELVPECREYYGDQEFPSSKVLRGGEEEARERARSSNTQLSRNSLARPRPGAQQAQQPQQSSRPAPVTLQEVLDRPSQGRARPVRPTSPPPPPPPPPATQRPARLEVSHSPLLLTFVITNHLPGHHKQTQSEDQLQANSGDDPTYPSLHHPDFVQSGQTFLVKVRAE